MGQFYCENKLHTPAVLRSSRVNDGVCDCCDGTDEYNGLVLCENTCEEAGRAAREEAERLQRVWEQGFAKRQELITQGQQGKQEKEARRSALQQEMEAASKKADELEELKLQAEEPEKQAKEAFDTKWQGVYLLFRLKEEEDDDEEEEEEDDDEERSNAMLFTLEQQQTPQTHAHAHTDPPCVSL